MNILTNEEAMALIKMPKKTILNDEMQDKYCMRFPQSIYGRYEMRSTDGNDIFLMHVRQGKLHTKISFYFQENSRYVGLLRIDYNGPEHKNPSIINEFVPRYASRYANQHIAGSHIHVYVQGYKPLAWAVPIADCDFSVKEMNDIHTFSSALDEFCGIINLNTYITYDGRMFL